MLGAAESLSIRVNALIERIGVLRSELFRSVLTKRYELTDAFDSELIDDVQTEFSSFYRAVSSWLRFVFQFKIQAALAATFFAVVAAVVLLVGGRRAFSRVFRRRSHRAGPILSQPAVRRVLVDTAADRGARRLPRLDDFLFQLFQRAARRHRDLPEFAVSPSSGSFSASIGLPMRCCRPACPTGG